MAKFDEKKYSFEFSFDEYLLILNSLNFSARYNDPAVSGLFRDLHDKIFILPGLFQ